MDRNHTYKIFDYYFEYKKKYPDQYIDLMVVANIIPRERRERLQDHGVKYKEIPEKTFVDDLDGVLMLSESQSNAEKPTLNNFNDQNSINVHMKTTGNTISIDEFKNKVPFMKGKPYWSNGEPRGAAKQFFVTMVEASCFTVNEIQEAMKERYPEIKEGTLKGYPRHATNEKGDDKDKNRMPYKAVIDAEGIIKFDKNYPRGSW